MKNFTQIPNEVATAPLTDAVCRLLLYCHGNTDAFRYNVPHLVEVLRKDKRSVQGYIKQLKEANVFILTTPQQVRHGLIPNYLFNREAVIPYLRNLLRDTQSIATHEMNPRNEPTQWDHANNTNKQDQETIQENNTGLGGIASQVEASGFDLGSCIPSTTAPGTVALISNSPSNGQVEVKQLGRSGNGVQVCSAPVKTSGKINPEQHKAFVASLEEKYKAMPKWQAEKFIQLEIEKHYKTQWRMEGWKSL